LPNFPILVVIFVDQNTTVTSMAEYFDDCDAMQFAGPYGSWMSIDAALQIAEMRRLETVETETKSETSHDFVIHRRLVTH